MLIVNLKLTNMKIIKIIRAYFDVFYGVDSFKLEVKWRRVLMNVFAILFMFAGLISFVSLGEEYHFFEAFLVGLFLVIGALLFMFSE